MSARHILAIAGTFGLLLTAALVPGMAAAQSAPSLQQQFPNVIASQIINPTSGPTTVTAGNISVSIPTGALGSSPATFNIVQGPAGPITPSGTTAVTDWAFQVTNNVTGQPISQFTDPVTVSVSSSAITPGSEYWNVAPTGTLSLNPIAPSITGETLTHKIAADSVGWAIVNPNPAIDFTQHGFPTIIAKTAFQPGQAITLGIPNLRVAIPANAFNIPVTVELLQGRVSTFAKTVPSGQSIVTDFALKVVDPATQNLVGTFNAPVIAAITSPNITKKSLYLNVSATGAITSNPIPPTIQGRRLTHPIAAAAVGWLVTTPQQSRMVSPKPPNLGPDGFLHMVARAPYTPGHTTRVGSSHSVELLVPKDAFRTRVIIEILQGPVSKFQHVVPRNQRVLTDFAVHVINLTTHQPILHFHAPIIARVVPQDSGGLSLLLKVNKHF